MKTRITVQSPEYFDAVEIINEARQGMACYTQEEIAQAKRLKEEVKLSLSFDIIEETDHSAMIKFRNNRYLMFAFNRMFQDGVKSFTKTEYEDELINGKLDLQWSISSHRSEFKPLNATQLKILNYIR